MPRTTKNKPTSAAEAAFAKLAKSFANPQPVTLLPGEAAALYRVIHNMGVRPDYIADRAAGIGCNTDWQNPSTQP